MPNPAEEARERAIAALWGLFTAVHPDTPREHVEALVDDLEVFIAGSAIDTMNASAGP